jgi:hypothetical protein
MTLGELIKAFKEAEKADSIIPLVESAELRNGVVAWKSVRVTYKGSTQCGEKEDHLKWEWMWQQVEFDMRSFGVVAGVKPQDAQSLFLRLKGLRLIYPDGTVNDIATKYLVGLVMNKLPKNK